MPRNLLVVAFLLLGLTSLWPFSARADIAFRCTFENSRGDNFHVPDGVQFEMFFENGKKLPAGLSPMWKAGDELTIVLSDDAEMDIVEVIHTVIGCRMGTRSHVIEIRERISKQTAQNFSRLVEFLMRQGTGNFAIYLNSDGGSIPAAMLIGRTIAQMKWSRAVGHSYGTSEWRCLSACVLIAAAAQRRGIITGGRVGIHRPHIRDLDIGNVRYDQLHDKYSMVFREMREYLSSFGVSSGLIELMKVTPSKEMKFLNSEDLEKFGLGPDNIMYGELVRSQIEAKCGQEYFWHFEKYKEIRKNCFVAKILSKSNIDHTDEFSKCDDIAQYNMNSQFEWQQKRECHK